MKRRQYKTEAQADEVLKEAVWLAWQATEGFKGAGFFQDRPTATKDEVFSRAFNEGDYCARFSKDKHLHADYVFGRMLKLRVTRPTPNVLEFSDDVPRPDYQSWSHKYGTYVALFDAAEINVILGPIRIRTR